MALPPPRQLLELIASVPRPAGGEAERDARSQCRRWLESLGFTTEERAFEYSALPGRWGTPLAGVASVLGFVVVTRLAMAGRPGLALGAVAVAGAVGVATGRWVARDGVLDLPLMRRRSVNLLARRGEPEVWLAAHLDTKSQPVPIGVRAAGVAATGLAWLAVVVILAAQLLGWSVGDGTVWWLLLGFGAAAAVPVMLTTVGSSSAGAVDDASGVATVLHAAALLPSELPLGVAITSAEELGLAGARAWARGTPPATALNVDGVDDDGETIAMYTGGRPRRVCRALAEASDGSAASGEEARGGVRCRRLLPGILTDGVALADAGWEVVTVSRGTRRTLQRIHSARDDLARLSGAGVLPTATAIAAAVRRLSAEAGSARAAVGRGVPAAPER